MKLADEDDALSSILLPFLIADGMYADHSEEPAPRVGAVGAVLDPEDDWVIPLGFVWLWPLRLTPCPDVRPELCDWSPSSRHTHAHNKVQD